MTDTVLSSSAEEDAAIEYQRLQRAPASTNADYRQVLWANALSGVVREYLNAAAALASSDANLQAALGVLLTVPDQKRPAITKAMSDAATTAAAAP
ncbi:MAG: hypothetical protein QOF51_334 [Chloroflexota bacterium]|jgi:hypothetical protein|nr:hypothetical protein [Chloroflexota bacterium]